MSGTREGALKAAATNRARYGEKYYAEIGRKGGSASTPHGGFGFSHERAVEAGRKGGKVSRRGKNGSHKIRVKQIESTDEVLVSRGISVKRIDEISQKIAVNYGEVLKKLEKE